MSLNIFYITHLVVPESLPDRGLRKLFFYTTKKLDSPTQFYWGAGNNSFSSEELYNKVKCGKLIKLITPIELKPKKGLWVDNTGTVHYADLISPNKDTERFDTGTKIFRYIKL